MTLDQKKAVVQALVNDEEATSELIGVYLDDAKYAILNRRYPFGFADSTEIETRYEMLQCKLASRYFLRRGGEGEISHTENGVSRIYKSVNDSDLLDEVIQIVKV